MTVLGRRQSRRGTPCILFDRMEDRIDQLAIEVREMNGVMRDQLRVYSLGTIGAMTALTAIFSLVVTFFA